MDMHLSTMLECKKCNWFLSECNMSCSLLTTVTSNKCQYLHQYWLFLWHYFWHVPIRHRGRDLECQTANSMPQMKLVCSLSAIVNNHIFTKTRSPCGAFFGMSSLGIGEGIWNVRMQIACINQPQMKLVCSLSAIVSSHISAKTRSFHGVFLDSDFL